VAPAEVPPLPASLSEWEGLRGQLLGQLKELCFRNWPADAPPLDVRQTADHTAEGLHLTALDCATEENLRVPVYVVRGAKHARPSLLVLTAVDDAGWRKWLAEMAPAFAAQLPGGAAAQPDQSAFAATARMLDRNDWAFAVVPPRGEGPGRWDPDPRADAQIRRRFLLLGRTADDAQVWDVRRAPAALWTREEFASARLWLQGEGRMAGVALYAGVFEPAVERFDLHLLPASHRGGPVFLNVQRVLEMPQAVALAYPKKVILYDVVPAPWSWAEAVAKLYGDDKPPLQFRTSKP
jgi:hypothetical protein